ncbi:L-threonine aldolase [Rhizobium sp. RU20A]|uniref:threonine aldolase family protein n=1 Tax=Rhizobium sp. RU20A TaxID=1907412 RepID=UPI0009543720|nr:beta-eliminating lyase-related protein [Rhizobium sp. RU20A]SIQ39817.1 L-threonine aldolase [Rhizobium sp. RU20A]
MIFSSDNWAGAHPAISDALAAAASGYSPAYGAGEIDRRVTARFSEIFERDAAVFFVSTGTAANSLAMAAVNRPGGHILCHPEAHLAVDECSAPQFFAHGSRVTAIGGAFGRMNPAPLETTLATLAAGRIPAGQAMAVTITQGTEAGTLYGLDDIAAIGDICQRYALPFHMDGARFANALVSLGTTPAEMTWKRGVTHLSFGGTKNGCWCAEALIVFDPGKAHDLPFIHKQSAQVISKSRFVSAQFEAYFRDDLWLGLARTANAAAARLADGIRRSRTARLAWEPAINEVFAILPTATAAALRARGAAFYEWPVPTDLALGEGAELYRFVTSFATTDAEVDAFLAAI